MEKIIHLSRLWDYVDKFTQKHFPDNEFSPILGGGKEQNPKFMIVFINPTKRNISSHPGWCGPKFPFIGRKRPWIEFAKAGIFTDENLLDQIRTNTDWSVDFTLQVKKHLEEQSIYLTNIVKNTGFDATLPNARFIELYRKIFEKEVELIKPKYIIAFGLIPLNAMVDEKIKLSEYYETAMKTGKVEFYYCNIGDTCYKVIPCYYPIGRGNPRKAIELLKLIRLLD